MLTNSQRVKRAALRAMARVRGEDEDTVQRHLITYLHIAHPELLRVTFHVPNGLHAASRVQAARMVGLGLKAGVADLICLAPRGPFAFLVLELKAKHEKPNANQLEFLEACRFEGGKATWADTFENARAVFDDYAALGAWHHAAEYQTRNERR